MTVRETFELDWSQALRGADQLDRALSQASSRFHTSISQALSQLNATVKISADARALTGSVDAALDNADTTVEVTAEAAEITGAIDAAVENANTHVEITGDASQLTGAVDSALQNASKSAAGASKELKGTALNAGLVGYGLQNAGIELSKFGVAAGVTAVAGAALFGSFIKAGSDLNESFNKANVVFGDSISLIREFGETSARSVGLSKQAAYEALGTFGNLFNALGSTRREAAGMSVETVKLAADLASFNNIPVDEALERLRSGLVGEIEPLRRLGISFNAAQVEAKAMELGLADVNGEISEGAKVQARLALITEQSGNALGDFARTSDDLANKTRIIKAEFQDTGARIGTQLLPVILQLAQTVEPLISLFGDLATTIIGPLAQALSVINGPLKAASASFVSTEQNVSVFEQAIDRLANKADKFSTAQIVSGFRLLQDAARSGIFTGEQYSTTLDVFRRVAETNIPAAKRLAAAVRDQGGDTEKLDKIIRKATQAQEASSRAMLDGAKAAQAQAQSLQELLTATDALVAGQLSLEDSLFRVEDAQTDLDDAYKEGNVGEVARKVNDLEQAWSDASVKVKEHTMETSNFTDESLRAAQGTRAQIDYLSGLASTLSPGSPLRVFLDQYLAQLQKTQGTFVSTVRVDAANALFVLEELRRQGGFALDPFSFIVNPDSQSVDQHAVGGTVRGPIGQPRLIVAHGGERVLRRDEQIAQTPAPAGPTIGTLVLQQPVPDPVRFGLQAAKVLQTASYLAGY